MLKTLYRFARDFRKINFSQRSYVNAIYNVDGKEIPITIADAPPAPDKMSAVQQKALQSALQTWATSCKESGVEPLLLYIPCKRRVFHGYLKPSRDYPEPAWQLNDLPAYVAREATTLGIRCIDSTPALTELAAKGVLTYNAIYDTHLNREGHRVVAEVLAKALGNVAPAQPAISASSR